MGIFLALLHHPVLNRTGVVGTTSVTNVDLHDLARAGRTYGVERFFVVTPVSLQQELVGRVIRHWTEGSGSERVPPRAQAFGITEVAPSLEAAEQRIAEITGQAPVIAVTGAGFREGTTPFDQVGARFRSSTEPLLVLFGTGYGLAPDVVARAQIRLPAILGSAPDGYNHLSVRAAAIVVLDRLLGDAPSLAPAQPSSENESTP